MTRRSAGMIFLIISTILFCMRYIVAAIYGVGKLTSEYSNHSFELFLSYVGVLPIILSIIALILGIFYIIWAEFDKKTT